MNVPPKKSSLEQCGTGVAKPVKKCWGCGKEEENGQPKLRKCSKCVKLNILPSWFCSQECLCESWPRHKEWHQHQKRDKKTLHSTLKPQYCDNIDNLLKNYASDLNLKDKDYLRLCKEGHSCLLAKDYLNAKKKLRKAIKCDPSRPDAYIHLCYVHSACYQFEEAVTYAVGHLERLCFDCLSGREVNAELGKQATGMDYETYINKEFSRSIFLAVQLLMYKIPHTDKKPAWYCQDVVLKRVVRFVRRCLFETKQVAVAHRITEFYAMILGGCVKKGIRSSTTESDPEIVARISMEDAEELRDCYKTLGQRDAELSILEDIAIKRQHPQQPTVKIFEGCWVMVHGLTSAAGQSLNKKLGLVTTELGGKIQGRFGVQVDGADGIKSLKVENLIAVPMSEREFIMAACLAESDKWSCVRPILVKYIPILGSQVLEDL